MLSVLNDPDATVARKDDMAKASAPYIHPRLGLLAATERANRAIDVTPSEITIVTIPRGYFRMPDGSFQPLTPEQLLALGPEPRALSPPEPEPVEPPLSEPTVLTTPYRRLKVVGEDDDPAS